MRRENIDDIRPENLAIYYSTCSYNGVFEVYSVFDITNDNQ